ncbi:MAG TPA: glycosyltransferase family 1 protein [Thermomicrobiales bacterium]|nr:glycosyltransferase family 1 protein [Thermomicrobiales bacterium]
MHIGIDARLAAYRDTGIARYTRSLLAALLTLDRANQYTVFTARGAEPLVDAPGRATHRALFTPPHHRLERAALGVELAPLRLDLLHSPDFIPPRLRPGTRAVVTVHDLAFLRDPNLLDPAARRYYGQLPAAVARADAIIAVSASTRRDLIDLAGAPPEKIEVIHEAADARYRPLDRAERLAGTARLGGRFPDLARLVSGEFGRFLLFVGTIEPRKNLLLLCEAYERYRTRAGRRAATLVLAGAPGWQHERELAAIERLRAAGKLVWFERATDDQLLLLYNAATLLALPSRYEGFGLTALEAMACGTPVLAADTASLPEVVGDAGTLLPPDDADAWAAALLELSEDRIRREAAIAAGLKQAARFSWARAAEQTLALYRRVAGQEETPPTPEMVRSCRR